MKLCYALALLASTSLYTTAVRVGPSENNLQEVKSEIAEITGNTKCDSDIPGACKEDEEFEKEFAKEHSRMKANFDRRRKIVNKEEK